MLRLASIFILLFLSACASSVQRVGSTSITKTLVQNKQQRPSVVLIHGCGGTAPHQHWMKILDDNGFNAVLIDYISLRGYSSICDLNAPINVDGVTADVNDVVGWVTRQEWHLGAVSVMGFSFGGSIVNAITDAENLIAKGIPVNHLQQVQRIISVYPQCALAGLAINTKISTQVHFGLSDYWTHHTMCQTEKLEKERYEFIYYENSKHGFDIPNTPTHVNGINRLEFNPQAFAQMQKNVIRFLRQ